MKKNQNGVSMITLVITIIVIIILAAVAFSSSTETITNANFSNFANNIGEVRTAFAAAATTLKGNEAKNETERIDEQVYNYVAKKGESGEWLPRALARNLACTEITNDAAKEYLDMELPTTKVNTDEATGVAVSYFVTREGDIFVWPPYEYEGEFYVNDTTKVIESGDSTKTPIKSDSDNVTKMYTQDKFGFYVGDVLIVVDNSTDDGKFDEGSLTTSATKATATVAFKDAKVSPDATGLETTYHFKEANGSN